MGMNDTPITVIFTNPVVAISGSSGTSGTSGVAYGNLEGGAPDSDYSGVTPIDCGGVT